MINKIIQFSIQNKFITGMLLLSFLLWGAYSFTQLRVDALPDVTNNQVQVNTVSPNLATQEMEQFITYPLETQLIYLQTEFKRQNELQEDRIKSTKTLQQVQNELSIAQARQTGLNNIGTLFLQLKNRTEYVGFKKIEQIKAISLS